MLNLNFSLLFVVLLFAIVFITGCEGKEKKEVQKIELTTGEVRDTTRPDRAEQKDEKEEGAKMEEKEEFVPNKADIKPIELKEDEELHLIMETEKGVIDILMYPKSAPMNVGNMVYLADNGYFDGVIFHRVIANFMAQGGDPTGTGRGGPGYQLKDEFDFKLHHSRGTLSMANSGPNTNGSQFFICFETSRVKHLDGVHTILGEVVGDGMTVVDRITQGDKITKVRSKIVQKNKADKE